LTRSLMRGIQPIASWPEPRKQMSPIAPKLARRIASPRVAELASTDLAQALAAQPAAKRSEQDNATIWEQLIALPMAAHYQRAFVGATGLPLRFAATAGLAELERLSGPHCTFVGLPGCQPQACSLKLRTVREDQEAKGVVVCVCCMGSATEALVPVLIGPAHVGNLVVGPFALRAPGGRDRQTLGKLLREHAPQQTPGKFWKRLEHLPVVTAARYHAATTLAHLLGQYLSEFGNRLVLEAATERSPLLRKIERYCAERGTNAVPLAELARAVGVSPTHLCRRFKQETGLTLSAYRLRQRIEQAKALLADRQRQVCEVAFAVGFGSAAHFNRVFRRVVGCAPSQYRLPSSPPRVARRERTRSVKKNIIRA
jgi:AraC-like DNA-binding protein